ncbi:hypothetical protein [Clavibacter zhangzhiyongii]|uniref:hypothetical protein n=1 Tax=Clavibacter zhangzhiyongii TaxID=2768071 RepID=UPI0039E1F318
MKPLDPRLLRHSVRARAMLAVGALVGVVQTVALVGFCWSLTQLVVQAIAGRTATELGPAVALVVASAVVRGVAGVAARRGRARAAPRRSRPSSAGARSGRSPTSAPPGPPAGAARASRRSSARGSTRSTRTSRGTCRS